MPTAATKKRRIAGDELREKIRTQRGYGAEKLLNQKPWSKQLEIERFVFDGPFRRTEVSGCVSSTKTFSAAMIALVWLMAFKPSRVFSLAPSFRQVDTNIWGYIQRLWAAAKQNGTPISEDKDIYAIPHINLGRDKDGKQVLDWTYSGFATDQPHNVHGIHGVNDLLILDDAHGISQRIMDELENMTAGGNTRVLMLYNKMVLSGPTYACNHQEKALWNHVGISYSDLEEARRRGFFLPGALEREAAVRWEKKYGVQSNFYRTKVLNEYPKQEADTLIPLDWIELAYDRKADARGPLVIGGDVGAEGDDFSALAPMRGRMVGEITEWHEPDTMATVGRFVKALKDEEASGKSKAYAFIDSVGLGGPVVNRMAELGVKVEGINGGDAAEGTVIDAGVSKPARDVYKNKRSQIWWLLREALNPSNQNLIGLTLDDDLTAQLSCIKWRIGSDGRIEVEPKIGTSLASGGSAGWGIKRRLGFSPDKADALSYAVWGASRAAGLDFISAGEDQTTAAKGKGDGKFLSAGPQDSGAFLDGIDPGGGVET